ncbi:MAG TPA: hypothetical protein VFG23_25335 [Polyangia bacterium]|nr:hypothetical protein [Polyangia bacterium]
MQRGVRAAFTIAKAKEKAETAGKTFDRAAFIEIMKKQERGSNRP